VQHQYYISAKIDKVPILNYLFFGGDSVSKACQLGVEGLLFESETNAFVCHLLKLSLKQSKQQVSGGKHQAICYVIMHIYLLSMLPASSARLPAFALCRPTDANISEPIAANHVCLCPLTFEIRWLTGSNIVWRYPGRYASLKPPMTIIF